MRYPGELLTENGFVIEKPQIEDNRQWRARRGKKGRSFRPRWIMRALQFSGDLLRTYSRPPISSFEILRHLIVPW